MSLLLDQGLSGPAANGQPRLHQLTGPHTRPGRGPPRRPGDKKSVAHSSSTASPEGTAIPNVQARSHRRKLLGE